MIEPRCVLLVAGKEMRDAVRNRWFLLYAGIFAALAVGLAFLSTLGASSFGRVGYGRTSAVLVNLVGLIVPLMALSAGGSSLAGEKERGTLDYLLAQPLDRAEILLGKFCGLAAALSAALAGGFGVSAAAMALAGARGELASFGMLVGLSLVLAIAMLAVGLAISSVTPRASMAGGIAIVVWLGFVLLTDLGLMSSSVVFRLAPSELLRLALADPVEVFKLAVLSRVNPALDMLGPAGVYATTTYGRGLPWLFAGVLVGWIAVPLGAAAAGLRRTSRP